MLSRLIHQAKAFVMNASIEQTEVATKMDSIISRLDAIQNKQPEVMKELHKHFESSINHAVRNLGEYLKSPHGWKARNFSSYKLCLARLLGNQSSLIAVHNKLTILVQRYETFFSFAVNPALFSH